MQFNYKISKEKKLKENELIFSRVWSIRLYISYIISCSNLWKKVCEMSTHLSLIWTIIFRLDSMPIVSVAPSWPRSSIRRLRRKHWRWKESTKEGSSEDFNLFLFSLRLIDLTIFAADSSPFSRTRNGQRVRRGSTSSLSSHSINEPLSRHSLFLHICWFPFFIPLIDLISLANAHYQTLVCYKLVINVDCKVSPNCIFST